MTRRQSVRRKLAERSPTSELRRTIGRVTAAVLDVTQDNYPNDTVFCVQLSLITAEALQHFGVSAQAMPVSFAITDMNRHYLSVPARLGFAEVHPEPTFIAFIEHGLLTPTQQVAIDTPHLHVRGISAICYLACPAHGWEVRMVDGVRPIMPRGATDTEVLKLYYAQLSGGTGGHRPRGQGCRARPR